jgi:hypothetical protein
VPYRTNRKRKVIYRLIFSITKEVLVVAARIQYGATFLFINISLKSSIELGYGVIVVTSQIIKAKWLLQARMHASA